MNLLRFLLFLLFTTLFASGQTPNNSANFSNQPEALVRSLYTEVVARHPLGISIGAENMKVFTPYFSKALLHRIDLAMTCNDDWVRRNPDPNSKPPGLEGGIFTGDDLRAEPQAFHIEKVQAEKDGFIHVYV